VQKSDASRRLSAHAASLRGSSTRRFGESPQRLSGHVASSEAGQPFRRSQGERSLVSTYAGCFEDETSSPAGDRTVEPQRIKVGKKEAERERVGERQFPSSRAAISAFKRLRLQIARWKRPCAVPWLVIV
jgi:hypothetical protein